MSQVATDTYLPIGLVFPSPTNPRKRFDETAIAELAKSLHEDGMLQAILVRPVGDLYEIVAGERRYRATKLNESPEILVRIKPLTDQQVRRAQLLENNQRQDVHPFEEAVAMRACRDNGDFGPGVEGIKAMADQLGKSPKYVYDRLKLLSLTEEAQQEFLDGAITAGHAILLARLTPWAQTEAITELLFTKDYVNNNEGKRGSRADRSIKSVREFDAWIERYWRLPLAKAPFDREDANLMAPHAGACSACPKRTKHDADITGDTGEDRCLDRFCFNCKVDSHVTNELARFKTETGKAPKRISTQNYNAPKGVMSADNWKKAKQGEHGAIPAVITHSDSMERLGESLWIREEVNHRVGSYAPPAKTGDELKARKEEIRALKAENLARERIYEACAAAIMGDTFLDRPTGIWAQLIEAIVLKLAIHNNDYVGSVCACKGPGVSETREACGMGGKNSGGAKDPDLRRAKKLSSNKLLLGALMASARDDIPYHDYSKPDGIALFAFAAALKVDVEGIRRQSDFDTLSRREQLARTLASGNRPEAVKPLAGEQLRFESEALEPGEETDQAEPPATDDKPGFDEFTLPEHWRGEETIDAKTFDWLVSHTATDLITEEMLIDLPRKTDALFDLRSKPYVCTIVLPAEGEPVRTVRLWPAYPFAEMPNPNEKPIGDMPSRVAFWFQRQQYVTGNVPSAIILHRGTA